MRGLLVVIGLVACVDQGPGPQGKKIDPGYVTSHVLRAAPPDLTRFDVPVGGRLVYLGNKLDKPSVAPGGTVRVTHYWQVLAPVGPSWRVFALVRGAPNTADFMNLPATDMELARGPATWKSGEIIEDVQDITLRPDWKSPTATLLVGVIELGAHGTGDRMVTTGPHVQDRAIVARVLEVDLSKAPPPPGTVYVPRATTPITIDGVASEQAWLTAAASPELVTGEGSPEPVGKATAKLTWDDQNLYVFITVTDSDIVTPYKKHDDSLWKADCVEMFIDADGNRRGYVELQVNPNNATFDSWFAGTRAQPGDPSWDSGMQTAVKVRGTTDPGDTDQGWDAEIAIPWAAVKGRDEAMTVHLPPQVGDRWRMNVVRVDLKTGDKNVAVSSWNRITYADFHALDRMLTVVFADPTGSIVPNANGPAGAGSGSATVVAPGTGSAELPPGAGSAAIAPRATPPGTPGAGSAAIAPGAGSAATRPTPPRVPSGAGSAATPPGAATSGAGSAAITPRAVQGGGSAAIPPHATLPGAPTSPLGAGSAATPPRAAPPDRRTPAGSGTVP